MQFNFVLHISELVVYIYNTAEKRSLPQITVMFTLCK